VDELRVIQFFRELLGARRAQDFCAAHVDGADGFSKQQWREVAREDFDFRQFRHGVRLIARDVEEKPTADKCFSFAQGDAQLSSRLVVL
jgi:hypothetical protein